MKSLLTDFIPYLDKIYVGLKPLWGKMTAHHMVEHLILAVRTSNNKLKVACFNPPEKIPTLKRFLVSNRPLPKEFMSPIIGPDLLPLEFNSLDEAIKNLKIEIEEYISFFDDNPSAILTNPTFGDLNREEWEIFHQKHFTHHLKQFGLL